MRKEYVEIKLLAANKYRSHNIFHILVITFILVFSAILVKHKRETVDCSFIVFGPVL